MTGRLDRYGETIEDRDDPVSLSDALADLATDYIPRSREEIRAHCADLRAVLAATRAPEGPTYPSQAHGPNITTGGPPSR